ncbi:ABC transporter transmembrane domain-containing protein [Polyangium sp. y55x31]|uniref:ABC transporter ATP-binding protein n=1 Tax=Polyangium sp. y55x31 TaxID=3042688 RepID=UPI002482E5B9|nr:ABC transporter transmembrane domain-containing protein [Polyangium sp. y55x31]MDI1480113.1 ABC transporter transmembrane domain-containing protein [Polyangium sp. y55x31]
MLFLAVESAAALLFPQMLRAIVDGASAHGGNTAPMSSAVAALTAAAFVQATALALRFTLFNVSGERVVARLRARLFERLLAQDTAFFDQHATGELTSRLTLDTAALQNVVTTNVPTLLRALVSMIGGACCLFQASPRLALLMLSIFPPATLGAVLYGRQVRRISRDFHDAMARAGQIAAEALAGIRTVHAFAAEQGEAERYATSILQGHHFGERRSRIVGTFLGAASFVVCGVVALVLWYGGHLMARGALSAGEMLSFLVYALMVAFSCSSLSDVWAELARTGGALERVVDLLERTPTIQHAGGLALPSVMGKIEFRQVDFCYPTRKRAPLLRGLCLTLHAGEVVALVGPSGAGKSTIAALLLRLYDPDRGTIVLDGVDLCDLSPRWLRRQIGLVSQDTPLFSGSVADNIRYGRGDSPDAEVEAAARTANAHAFICELPQGYRTLVGERGVQLSGGQRQRIAIARAILQAPPILILDEATSALDAGSETLVREALERLMKGRTTLIIAHRLSMVQAAHRVVVMSGGAIVQIGTPAELLQKEGLYRDLALLQRGRPTE